MLLLQHRCRRLSSGDNRCMLEKNNLKQSAYNPACGLSCTNSIFECALSHYLPLFTAFSLFYVVCYLLQFSWLVVESVGTRNKLSALLCYIMAKNGLTSSSFKLSPPFIVTMDRCCSVCEGLQYLSSAWMRMWLFKVLDCRNCLPQTEHSNGFSPVWIFRWFESVPVWRNVLLQYVHAYGFSPVWIFIWFARVVVWRNSFGQMLHLKGFMP